MTLLTTEVHHAADRDVIVFAADQRITRGERPAESRRKIFRLPKLNAGIGYFGLAEVPAGPSNQPMAEWIQDFFYEIRPGDTLGHFAQRLTDRLNAAVPSGHRYSEASGFHLAGLDPQGRAEFWYIRNIDDSGVVTRNDYEAREDFKARDLPALPDEAIQVYRNGDVRAHVAAWQKIDEAFGALLGTPSFRTLHRVSDYVDWVKYKMETVANFYEQFATESIIGRPIDAFAIEHGA